MMYGKIFASMFNGSMRGHGVPQLVFTYMLCNCSQEGVFDQIPQCIADATGFPLQEVLKAIAYLESPDPSSRSKVDDGRRIRLLDATRSWGWEIVNHAHYRSLSTKEAMLEADRVRKRLRSGKSVLDLSSTKSEVPEKSSTTPETHEYEDDPANVSMGGGLGEGKVVQKIPINTGEDVPVCESAVKEWETLYPQVDVVQTLNEIRGWCLANKSKRKTRGGVERFINSWLCREQNKPQPAGGVPQKGRMT